MKVTKTAALAGMALLLGSGLAMAQAPMTAGYDLEKPATEIDVPSGGADWSIAVGLVFDPTAGPIVKKFASPRQITGAPILIDAQQPFPLRVDEEWSLILGASQPVADWHEIVLTPGWHWQLITAAPLITRNGAPWPYEWVSVGDPTKIEVKFEPIAPGEILDIHKALLWVGTDGNRIWGDGVDDAGMPVDESGIRVLEYPTPEPASALLLGVAGAVALRSRRRT